MLSNRFFYKQAHNACVAVIDREEKESRSSHSKSMTRFVLLTPGYKYL